MPAIVDVSSALKDPGQPYAFEATLEPEALESPGDPLRFDDIAIRGDMMGAQERVSIRGEVTASVTGECARCLSPVTVPLRARIDALYARQDDPDDPDLYLFEGSKLDLTDAARDALLLELPYRFLCSEDCKGLCPRCGKNLNLGACTCQEGLSVPNPFSALRSMVQETIVQDDEEV